MRLHITNKKITSARWHKVVISAVAILLLSACENDLKDIRAIDRTIDNVDRYKEVRMTYSDSAAIRVTIEAPLMESHYEGARGREDRFPSGVFVTFLDSEGREESWLSAGSVIRYPSEELTVARDSVVLLSIHEDTLRTEELFWDSKKGEIYTSGAFRYSKPGERIYGYKFHTDQNFEKHTFEKMSGHMLRQMPD